jgi:hypothetical protein
VTDVLDAIAITKRALPDASFGLRALVVAIGGLESHWGDGWPGTNNWGAITAGSGWTGPTFDHADSRWTKTGVVQYVTQFRQYDSPEAGAADLGRVLQSQYAKAVTAAEQARWPDVSKFLYEGGYYTGTQPPKEAIAAHYKRLRVLLLEQGISAPLVAAAVGAEWLFWGAVAAFVWFKRRAR